MRTKFFFNFNFHIHTDLFCSKSTKNIILVLNEIKLFQSYNMINYVKVLLYTILT